MFFRYLHASSDQYGRPIAGQHEICAYHNEEGSNLWLAQVSSSCFGIDCFL